MYELIILGLIPGTQMQITFTSWLILAACIVSVTLIWNIYRSKKLRQTIVSIAWLRAVNHAQLSENMSV
jgi:hypothetical protein